MHRTKSTNHGRIIGNPVVPPELPPPCYIDRLPFEILTMIFRLCEDERQDDILSDGDSMNLHTYALVFSQVCRFWRTVTVNTAQLWSAIYIDSWFECLTQHLAQSFAHSKESALTVVIVPRDMTVFYNMFTYLQSILTRLIILRVDNRPAKYKMTLDTIPCATLASDSLRVLQLRGIRFTSYINVLNLLAGFPNLQVVDLSNSYTDLKYKPIDLGSESLPDQPDITLAHVEIVIFSVSLIIPLRERALLPSLHFAALVDEHFWMKRVDGVNFVVYGCPKDSHICKVGTRDFLEPIFASIPELDYLTITANCHAISLQANYLVEAISEPRWGTFVPPGGPFTRTTIESEGRGFILPSLRHLRLENCLIQDLSPLFKRYQPLEGVECPDQLETIEVTGSRPPARWDEWTARFAELGTTLVGTFGVDEGYVDPTNH
ncbi:hypothetical protein CALCODRAFT_496988 [Calocera cornea HHB12733]|uniref:Uncharacterized protein n=1 Tax=Calocera cornea HHB12733 TaxID=1353952 RepID=A0A165FJ10_9BASI|nr:hypothetical protein CALCODRAFT_496988 [Calocera cornea HHB12733]